MTPDDAPEVQQFLQEVEPSLRRELAPIENDTQYNETAVSLAVLKGHQRRLEELRKSFTRPLDQAKRAVLDWFRAPESRLAQAENEHKRVLREYQQETERRRIEEQRQLNEQAQREREALERKAATAAKRGKAEQAAALQERAALVVPAVVQAAAPKVGGLTYRTVWRYRITNELELPREFLIPDHKALGKVVDALKAHADINGVEVYSEQVVASGSL